MCNYWWAFCEQADTYSWQFQAIIFGYLVKKICHLDTSSNGVSQNTRAIPAVMLCYLLNVAFKGRLAPCELVWLRVTAVTF